MPAAQHSDQLVVGERAEPGVRVVGEPGQRHPGRQDVQRAPVGETTPVARPVPRQEPGRAELVRRPRRRAELVQLRAGQPGQLGRGIAIRIRHGPPLVRRDVVLIERGQRSGQDLLLRLRLRRRMNTSIHLPLVCADHVLRIFYRIETTI